MDYQTMTVFFSLVVLPAFAFGVVGIMYLVMLAIDAIRDDDRRYTIRSYREYLGRGR